MANIDTLIVDLETAPVGSRELDQRIWNVTRPSVKSFAPHYTTSLDAAMTLVPEGWRWVGGSNSPKGFAVQLMTSAVLAKDPSEVVAGQSLLGDHDGWVRGAHKDASIAWVIAALKARQEAR